MNGLTQPIDATPNAKKQRYDRQIRIWGQHGQSRLETAKVCLLNASATGTETLKNLVLGGIASFTVVDNARVSESDLGNNFMVDESHLDQSRARCTTELLKEFNEDVSGGYVEVDAEELIDNNPSFFSSFTMVIATQMRESYVVKLDEVCRKAGVCMIASSSYGMVGVLRISVCEHCVIESQPDDKLHDLRLSKPWPELQRFVDAMDLATMDKDALRLVPYAVLLIKAAQEWRAAHDGAAPKSSSERAAFKELIRSHQRFTIEGVPVEEENFNEAVAAAHKAWTEPTIPTEVKRILHDTAACNITAYSTDFWVMVAALKAFVDNEGGGTLPLEGSIPDMTASTEMYLALQKVYREKADADVAAVERHAQRIAAAAGRQSHISRDAIRKFCRNARNLCVVRYKPLAREYGERQCDVDAVRAALSDEDAAANASLYVLLRAVHRFHSMHGRYPGQLAGELDEDEGGLKSAAVALLSEMGVSDRGISDDLVGEMCRFGAAELHCVASIMGGMVAQEAIKLLTQQFVPVDGMLIVNTMACTTSVFRF